MGEKLILSNTVYSYSNYQNFVQAASRKAYRAGERRWVLVKNSPIKRLPNVFEYHMLCLCRFKTQYVVINQVFLGGYMANKKQTSSELASEAAKILRDPNASKIQKELAGSVLAQSSTDKQTSSEMETVASKVLQSDKYNETTKSLAGSVLSQSDGE
ncbi:hypothetical protein [Aeromonas hydrophila]|uniref:hypothetical protein n=1 Tax=Aeromonas hydrophila TaxID=644 RepID=UPI0030D183A0